MARDTCVGTWPSYPHREKIQQHPVTQTGLGYGRSALAAGDCATELLQGAIIAASDAVCNLVDGWLFSISSQPDYLSLQRGLSFACFVPRPDRKSTRLN